MAVVKFEDQKDLPIGSHEPCLLEEVRYSEPTEEQLEEWKDLQPSYMFRFKCHGGEYDGYTSIRFCNNSSSKLGHLYLFCADLSGQGELKEIDPESFKEKWFRIRVRKKQNGKLHVAGADPIPAPKNSDNGAQQAKETKTAAAKPAVAAVEEDDVPF